MKKNRFRLHYRFLLCLLIPSLVSGIAGCKKVIQVNLNGAAPQIVIEGEVTNGDGPFQVKISNTVNFSATNTFPPVSGAMVQVTDSNTGVVYVYNETTPGIYLSNGFGGAVNHTYQFSAAIAGTTYTASSTMPAAVLLDSVSFLRNVDLNNKSAINAVVNFQDPPGLGNYYQFTEFVNGFQVPDIFVFEDRLSDGKYVRDALYNDTIRLHHNDTVLMKMYCVDKNIYNYFFTLAAVTGNNSFRSASPANPNSNISNGALGYFSAHTVSQKKLVVY
jgi:hypothetical protein